MIAIQCRRHPKYTGIYPRRTLKVCEMCERIYMIRQWVESGKLVLAKGGD